MSDASSAAAAASRRRWISVAELVGLIGVVIAALGLWNSWADRRDGQAARAEAAAATAHAAGRIDLTGVPRNGGRELLLRDPRHDIQDVTVSFPSALGVTAQRPLADPVILADPLRDALLKGNDQHAGRVPVLVTTRVVDGDSARTASAIYDLIWSSKRGMIGLGGRLLRLEGIRLHARTGTQASLDALWARDKPARAG